MSKAFAVNNKNEGEIIMSSELIQDIANKFRELEREIQELKRDKAQAEGLCAAIMKRVGKIEEFSIKELFNADYEKVRFFPVDEKSSTSTVIYADSEQELNTVK